jgi:hypothetical protein
MKTDLFSPFDGRVVGEHWTIYNVVVGSGGELVVITRLATVPYKFQPFRSPLNERQRIQNGKVIKPDRELDQGRTCRIWDSGKPCRTIKLIFQIRVSLVRMQNRVIPYTSNIETAPEVRFVYTPRKVYAVPDDLIRKRPHCSMPNR